MSSFRGGRGGRPAFRGPPKGLFIDGVWHCECTPRLPSVHLQTKKEGANKGRWFYTCQMPQEERCKFFLWEDEAKPREAAAVLNNSRTEPSRPGTNITTPSRPTPSRTQPSPAQRVTSPPPPYSVEATPSRKRSRTSNADGDFAFEQGDDAFDEELDRVVAAAETPRKSARTEAFTTPARRKLPWQKENDANGLPTPQTDHRASAELFLTRFATPGGSLLTPSRMTPQDESGNTPRTSTPAVSPFETPTPSRFRDAVSSGSEDAHARDVFGVLRQNNVHINNQTEQALRDLFSKHSRTVEGIKKGREVSRLTIKAKEAKVTELQHRIDTLEAEMEAKKAVIEHLKWKSGSEQEPDF
ncbi:hypothetical protein P154DRAFT_535606 [Amniculicola lignicola CBS 123094]|uniref:GRF-type domain-containing protein n=1 Tax=Amniculicola lignicola CBS 123094 TaxID=1392246 RepID=A0A6A5WD36_9PLEO|nr:hypothetical protein P154DRAFT_535606 [Amniculicola lignicola CBS 123094]